MSYRWKPSRSARREFAEKMNNDAQFASNYYARKEARNQKRREGSKFDYSTAGGNYVPTQIQHNQAFHFLNSKELTIEQKEACNQVIYGFTCNEKIDHDYIHVVNELIRNSEHN
jgi:hypothetical protein